MFDQAEAENVFSRARLTRCVYDYRYSSGRKAGERRESGNDHFQQFVVVRWHLRALDRFPGRNLSSIYEVTRGRMRGFVPLDFKIRRILLPIDNIISLHSEKNSHVEMGLSRSLPVTLRTWAIPWLSRRTTPI